jgi:flavin-binding protein dodecin
MSVAKVIEITAGSDKNFEDAVRRGIKRASKTVKGISSAWVSEEKVVVKDGEVTEFRVTMRVTFMLSDKD